MYAWKLLHPFHYANQYLLSHIHTPKCHRQKKYFLHFCVVFSPHPPRALLGFNCMYWVVKY